MALLTATATLLPGSASAGGTGSGATLVATATLLAGSATGSVAATAPGATLNATAFLLAGSAVGVRSATVSGAILTATATLLPGSATGVVIAPSPVYSAEVIAGLTVRPAARCSITVRRLGESLVRPVRIWPGDVARADLTFTDDAGAPLAATGVALSWCDPAGAVHAAAVQAGTGVGVFVADIPTAAGPGTYFLRLTCTGPTPTAREEQFTVAPSLTTWS